MIAERAAEVRERIARAAARAGRRPDEVTLVAVGKTFPAETLRAAFHHRGFAFVRILQRCPQYTDQLFVEAVRDPARVELLVHADGIRAPQAERLFANHLAHDPGDLAAAFHSYWNLGNDRPDKRFIVVQDAELSGARLFLATQIGQLVRNGLALLGVEAVEEM